MCDCLRNVVGMNCSECAENYWGLSSGNGCEECTCNITGMQRIRLTMFVNLTDLQGRC